MDICPNPNKVELQPNFRGFVFLQSRKLNIGSISKAIDFCNVSKSMGYEQQWATESR
jgi:hypothetical protein